MTYEDFQTLKQDVKQYHPIVLPCVISNFEICQDKIISAITNRDVDKAIDEMASLTGLYDYATEIKYDKQMKSIVKMSIEAIATDFTIAKLQIESYFCHNYITGDFDINKEVLEANPFMVDWDAYWNTTSARFIQGCKIANNVVGFKKDAEVSKYYEEDKDRWNFKDIFYSSYNGGRVTASFEKEEDALQWSHMGYVEKESDGLWWSEQPAYWFKP